MNQVELPVDARAYDELSNKNFLRVCQSISFCVARGDLAFRSHIKGRHIGIVYRDGRSSVLGQYCRLSLPSEVLRSEVVEDYEISIGDLVVTIERQDSDVATLHRLAGAIEALMPK